MTVARFQAVRGLLLASLALAGVADAGEQASPPATPPAPAPARTPPPRGPAIALAIEAAQAAIAACSADGYRVGVTIVDSGSGVRLVVADDGARQQAVDSSTSKANTVVTFRESSAEVARKAAADPALAAQIAADPHLRARAGGLPLTVNGEIIGAIGVGGAPGGEKDEACARVAIAKIQDRLR